MQPNGGVGRTSGVNRTDVSLTGATRRPASGLAAPRPGSRPARASHDHQEESSTMNDTALFAAMSRGDRDALEVLYDRHARTLFALAMQLVQERTRAEDLLHDTFLDLARHARARRAVAPPVLRWLVQRLFARGAPASP